MPGLFGNHARSHEGYPVLVPHTLPTIVDFVILLRPTCVQPVGLVAVGDKVSVLRLRTDGWAPAAKKLVSADTSSGACLVAELVLQCLLSLTMSVAGAIVIAEGHGQACRVSVRYNGRLTARHARAS